MGIIENAENEGIEDPTAFKSKENENLTYSVTAFNQIDRHSKKITKSSHPLHTHTIENLRIVRRKNPTTAKRNDDNRPEIHWQELLSTQG